MSERTCRACHVKGAPKATHGVRHRGRLRGGGAVSATIDRAALVEDLRGMADRAGDLPLERRP